MKCPYCGEEMEEGLLQSMRNMYFTPPDVRLTSEWDSAVNDNIEKLTKQHALKDILFYAFRLPAWRCVSCGKMVADIQNEES